MAPDEGQRNKRGMFGLSPIMTITLLQHTQNRRVFHEKDHDIKATNSVLDQQ